MKTQPAPTIKKKPESNEGKKQVKKFAYWLAWVNFLAIVGLAVYNAIKDKQPPDKNDYFKE